MKVFNLTKGVNLVPLRYFALLWGELKPKIPLQNTDGARRLACEQAGGLIVPESLATQGLSRPFI